MVEVRRDISVRIDGATRAALNALAASYSLPGGDSELVRVLLVSALLGHHKASTRAAVAVYVNGTISAVAACSRFVVALRDDLARVASAAVGAPLRVTVPAVEEEEREDRDRFDLRVRLDSTLRERIDELAVLYRIHRRGSIMGLVPGPQQSFWAFLGRRAGAGRSASSEVFRWALEESLQQSDLGEVLGLYVGGKAKLDEIVGRSLAQARQEAAGLIGG